MKLTFRSRITGEGLDEEERFMFGIVADREMLHLFLFYKKFSWAFPRKFESKSDAFVVGGKVILVDKEKVKMN